MSLPPPSPPAAPSGNGWCDEGVAPPCLLGLAVWVWIVLILGALVCLCGFCGFFIDPRATPARVALGMLAIVVAANNYVNLSKAVPVSPHPAWLLRVVLGCLYFNAYGMLNVVIVSFGILSAKWLKEKQDALAEYMPWEEMLKRHRAKLVQLFKEWDQVSAVL